MSAKTTKDDAYLWLHCPEAAKRKYAEDYRRACELADHRLAQLRAEIGEERWRALQQRGKNRLTP